MPLLNTLHKRLIKTNTVWYKKTSLRYPQKNKLFPPHSWSWVVVPLPLEGPALLPQVGHKQARGGWRRLCGFRCCCCYSLAFRNALWEQYTDYGVWLHSLLTPLTYLYMAKSLLGLMFKISHPFYTNAPHALAKVFTQTFNKHKHTVNYLMVSTEKQANKQRKANLR